MDNSKKPDKNNPRQNANIVSHLLFLWMFPMLVKGAESGLNTNDLTQCLSSDHSKELANKLERKWKEELINANKRKKAPSLGNAIFKAFYTDTFIDGIYCFLFIFFRSCLPIVLGQLLLQFQYAIENNALTLIMNDRNETDDIIKNKTIENYLFNATINKNAKSVSVNDTNPNESTWNYYVNDEYFLSGILCILMFCGILCDHHSLIRLRMFGARIRVACTSLIYRKILTLSKTTSNQTSTGYLVNLISNDVGRFDFGFLHLHYLWITPIQVLAILYLLWLQIGCAAFVGVGSLLICTTPVQIVLSRISAYLRLRVAERTDFRVGIMNELIHGIQVIKMYAWEIPFGKVVANARNSEVNEIQKASYIRGFHLSIMVIFERTTLFITLLTIVLLNEKITANIVFSLAQFYNALQLTTAIFSALALLTGSEALISIKRVEEFLLLNEKNPEIVEESKSSLDTRTTTDFRKGPAINLMEQSTLMNGNKDIDNHAIIKNSPTNNHFNDLENISENAIIVNDLNASWNGSQKMTLDNINITVKKGQLCAIIGPVGAGKSSLLHMLLGELTPQSGTSITNGSISYASQEPWLFSESVIANILFGEEMDKERYKQVVYSCALRDDFTQLPNGEKTHVGEHGASLSGGQRARVSLARAVYKKATIYLLDDPLSAVDSHVGNHLFNEVIGPNGCLAKEKATRILVTHQVHFLKEADLIVIIDNGKILRQGTYTDLANSDDVDFAKLLKQINTPDEYTDTDENQSNIEDIPYIDGFKPNYTRFSSVSSRSLSKSASSTISLNVIDLPAEEQAEGGIAFRIWKKYFRSGAGACGLICFGMVLIFTQIVTSGSDYFVNYWTQQEQIRYTTGVPNLTTNDCLHFYIALITGVIFMNLLRSYVFVIICMNASKNLHNKMFTALLAAPMRFFDINPTGRILNRFSKDMGIIDEILPRVMMEAVQIFSIMIGIFCMVCIVNPWMIIALVIVIILFSLLMALYIRPSQDMKRLEGICRSPIFSYVAATFVGISTIRSRHMETILSNQFDALQDVHTAIYHLSFGGVGLFGLWLDILSASFVSVVTFSFISMENVPSGNVGLAISQALILTGMVQYGVRQMSESMLMMTSVERVIQYIDLKPEHCPVLKPSKSWPEKGRITMRNMSLQYDKESLPVLKHLNIDIESTWKVGIVGRTGAGKSSFINALFRMSHIDGNIIIDNIDTGTISLDSLRTKISIIPQEPILFTDTIRNNLDPFHKYTDDEIWEALESVEMKSAINTLDYKVTEAGSNFSVGQRQLLCLARAILRNNKILVLDEATANVDPQTDALIQQTIRSAFRKCTVLTIAHRLHTVMDSDRILVMDAGCAVEFDPPHLLLQHNSGLLRSMVDATGAQESEDLKRLAKGAYDKYHKQNF